MQHFFAKKNYSDLFEELHFDIKVDNFDLSDIRFDFKGIKLNG